MSEKLSYHIRIGTLRVLQDEEGCWGAYDENTNKLIYGGSENMGGVDGKQLLEVLRVLIKEEGME